MAYTIQFKPAALRQLHRIPRSIQNRILARIEMLARDPFPPGCRKLAGLQEAWRIRISDYRVIYQVHHGMLLVLVLTIGHRRDVYR